MRSRKQIINQSNTCFKITPTCDRTSNLKFGSLHLKKSILVIERMAMVFRLTNLFDHGLIKPKVKIPKIGPLIIPKTV